MTRGFSARALSAMAAVGLAAAVSAVAPGTANAAVNGTVTCDTYSSTFKVVGVWIDSSNNAHDGWAAWTAVSGSPWTATYSKSDIAESYKVNVGCGGSPSSWAQTAYSDFVTGGQDFICHVTATPSQRVCVS